MVERGETISVRNENLQILLERESGQKFKFDDNIYMVDHKRKLFMNKLKEISFTLEFIETSMNKWNESVLTRISDNVLYMESDPGKGMVSTLRPIVNESGFEYINITCSMLDTYDLDEFSDILHSGGKKVAHFDDFDRGNKYIIKNIMDYIENNKSNSDIRYILTSTRMGELKRIETEYKSSKNI